MKNPLKKSFIKLKEQKFKKLVGVSELGIFVFCLTPFAFNLSYFYLFGSGSTTLPINAVIQ